MLPKSCEHYIHFPPFKHLETGTKFSVLKAFFHRWWVEQSPEVHQEVKELVASGQLEFVYVHCSRGT